MVLIITLTIKLILNLRKISFIHLLYLKEYFNFTEKCMTHNVFSIHTSNILNHIYSTKLTITMCTIETSYIYIICSLIIPCCFYIKIYKCQIYKVWSSDLYQPCTVFIRTIYLWIISWSDYTIWSSEAPTAFWKLFNKVYESDAIITAVVMSYFYYYYYHSVILTKVGTVIIYCKQHTVNISIITQYLYFPQIF